MITGMVSIADQELARLRAMTAAEKLAVAEALWQEAWALKRAFLASLHPDWTENALDVATRQALSGP